mgnify:CR=1 FL=1
MKRLALLFSSLLVLAACGQKAEEKKPSGPPPALITTTTVQPGAFEIVEETLGTLESINDPRLAAEVAGKVARVQAFAGKAVKKGETLAVIDAADLALQTQADASEAARLEALLAQQEKLVERQQGLVAKGFLSQNAADDARAQRAALAGQLAAARARTDLSRRNVGKTTVTAPADGVIENQMVSAGDYVKVGDPMFQFVSNRKLRAHLPFPETAASRLARGQSVRMTSPQAPGRTFEGIINDIRPSLADGSRALTAVVDIDNNGALKSGGTVNALVRITAREGALTVPEQSVVLRPAGKVVYVIADTQGQLRAKQQVVQTGGKRDGRVEILSGLSGGETIALDGAGFLTNDTAVTVKK